MSTHLHMRGSLLLRLAIFVLLSGAVFGWGLHSKLSLYHTTEIRTVSSSVAKLLSQKERTGDTQASYGTRPKNDEHGGGSLPVALSILLLTGLALLRCSAPAHKAGQNFLPARKARLHMVSLFFRPPPPVQFSR